MGTVKCRWCQKTVRDKPILGTLHVCLSPEERRVVDYNNRMGRWQMDVQRRACAQSLTPLDTESKIMAK